MRIGSKQQRDQTLQSSPPVLGKVQSIFLWLGKRATFLRAAEANPCQEQPSWYSPC